VEGRRAALHIVEFEALAEKVAANTVGTDLIETCAFDSGWPQTEKLPPALRR
jgi:hypothetical protein